MTQGDTSMNRRIQRRRMMQQRNRGFNISATESLKIMGQSLNTLDMLRDAAVKITGEKPWNQPRTQQVFDFSRRQLKIGQWIDVKDTIDQWLEAEVINVRGDEVYVHYNGWGYRWDEWLSMNSDRIAAFRTHTVQSPYSMYMSPNPYHVLDGDHSCKLRFIPSCT
jgi:RNA binding activity-knot of a chromodomain